nr:cytochrome b [Ficopomatus enigmaticus]
MIKSYSNKVSALNLPCALNLSNFWSIGSILGGLIAGQIVTGFFLSMSYSPSLESFSKMAHIHHDVNFGWALRSFHANGASMVMLAMYAHIGRGMYFSSYLSLMGVWVSGMVMGVLLMGISFLGYVLPWGQMSYWGATVITNLISVLPFGSILVEFIWGGYSVGEATLNRFFSLHFLLPFSVLPLLGIHFFFLHSLGSSNPLGVESDVECVAFHPSLTLSDFLGISVTAFFFSVIVFLYPFYLSDAANFEEANPLSTPPHIKPEWYFLPFYAILRSIPHKTLGVVAMVLSVLVVFIHPLICWMNHKYAGLNNFLFREFLFWGFVMNFFILGWIGSRPVEQPYIIIGQAHTVLYFLYFFLDYFSGSKQPSCNSKPKNKKVYMYEW